MFHRSSRRRSHEEGEASKHFPMDRVVFGVAAGLMVAFIAWGVFGTRVAERGRDHGAGRDHHRRRLGVRAGGERLRGVRGVARGEPLRQDPAGPRRRGARVPYRLVDRDDVQRRHGHRADVLRRRPSRCRTSPRRRRAPSRRARPRRSTWRWPPRCSTGRCTRGRSTPSSAWPSPTARFRRGRPQLISSAFIPLFGRKRAEGAFGKAVDILAIFATLFGSAASLGLGALQIGGGLTAGGFMDNVGTTLLVVIIVDADDLLHPLGGVRRLQGHPVAVEHQHGAGRGSRPGRVRRRPDGR